MKKLTAMLIGCMLIAGSLSACGKNDSSSSSKQSASETSTAESTEDTSAAETTAVTETDTTDNKTTEPSSGNTPSGSREDSPYIGKWTISKITDLESGTEYTDNFMGIPLDELMTIEITADKMITDTYGEVSEEAEWELDKDGNFTYHDEDGTVYSGYIKDGSLIIEEDGMIVTFSPADGSASTTTSAKTTVPHTTEPATQADTSKYKGGNVVGMWSVQNDIGVEASIEFRADNTAEVYINSSALLYVENGKLFSVLAEDASSTFDGKKLTITTPDGEEYLVIERISGETSKTDLDGLYKIITDSDDLLYTSENANMLLKIIGKDTYLGTDSYKYTISGNRLTIDMSGVGNLEDEVYTYDVKGDKITMVSDDGEVTEFVRIEE